MISGSGGGLGGSGSTSAVVASVTSVASVPLALTALVALVALVRLAAEAARLRFFAAAGALPDGSALRSLRVLPPIWGCEVRHWPRRQADA